MKERKVKSYQRRSKSGKMITVKGYSARYKSKEAKSTNSKKGAGRELKDKKMGVSEEFNKASDNKDFKLKYEGVLEALKDKISKAEGKDRETLIKQRERIKKSYEAHAKKFGYTPFKSKETPKKETKKSDPPKQTSNPIQKKLGRLELIRANKTKDDYESMISVIKGRLTGKDSWDERLNQAKLDKMKVGYKKHASAFQYKPIESLLGEKKK